MKTKLSSDKIFKYAYLALFLAVFLCAAYTYFFLFENVYQAIYFDESQYNNSLTKSSDINTARFNDVIRRIDTKQVKKDKEINNIFD